MLRAKAKFLASTDTHGQFAGIAIVVDVVNAINKTAPARMLMKSALGVAEKAWMPSLANERFRWGKAMSGAATVVTNGERTPGKVAAFATCRVNCNEPGIGNDLLRLLEHNNIPYAIVDKEKCCGIPKLELGDLPAVERNKNANIPVLARYARKGFASLSAIPGCTLMFKQELPLMFPDEANVQRVKKATFDPFEYLIARHKDGLLRLDFTTALGQRELSHPVPWPLARHWQED